MIARVSAANTILHLTVKADGGPFDGLIFSALCFRYRKLYGDECGYDEGQPTHDAAGVLLCEHLPSLYLVKSDDNVDRLLF